MDCLGELLSKLDEKRQQVMKIKRVRSLLPRPGLVVRVAWRADTSPLSVKASFDEAEILGWWFVKQFGAGLDLKDACMTDYVSQFDD